MSVFSILAVCLLSICSITGFVMFLLRKKFLTFNIEIEFKKMFYTCFAIPTIVETCELFLSLGALILVLCDCGTGGILNEKAYFWAGGLLSGMLIGAILGEIYWKKFKKPFFIQYFKDEYIKYIKEVKSMWVQTRVSYYECGTVGNFLWPIYSILFLGGILLSSLL